MLLKVGQVKFTETCFEGTRLDILVVEDEGYARTYNREKPPHYSFNFALKPECSKEPIPICKCTSFILYKYCSFRDGDLSNLSLKIDNMFFFLKYYYQLKYFIPFLDFVVLTTVQINAASTTMTMTCQ